MDDEKFIVSKDNDGIWITHPEPFGQGNRVGHICICDKSDVWYINISKETFNLWFTLGTHTIEESEVIQLVKQLMLFSQLGIEYQ